MGVDRRLWFLAFFFFQQHIRVLSDTCEQHTNCASCIRDPTVCVWCAKDQFTGSRCKSAKSNTDDWCPGSLQNPSFPAEATKNEEFNPDLGQVIQVRPQSYRLNLRPGVPINFTFSYKPATDYPVDLYFLFDTSTTMKAVRDDVQDQSKSIYDTMFNLTKNIKLGIGSFVDKNTLPYTDIINSTNTYSFRNNLPLQDNSSIFKDTIGTTTFGYNFDYPEGGLDALAQVISCGDLIGWRNESRKLVVFLTDSTYHVAGDGIIGGIFNPYDGKCHTDDNGVYTKELEMDYPSVSMINKLASDKEIAVVFAVPTKFLQVYRLLSNEISGSTHAVFDGKNHNIAGILTNIYNNIARKIKLKTNFESGNRNKFKIKFDPDCANEDCEVKEGEEVNITGTIELLEYYGAESTSVTVTIEGITEKVTLEINFINACECEAAAQPNSPECNEGGSRKCGICECNENRYGVNCACTKNSASSHRNDNSTCVMPDSNIECNGHGSCICGNCICRKNSPYEGKFCQYNKDNCPRNKNAVCSGHGRCEYERCICNNGWEGDACECPKTNATCIGVNGKVCNGMGSCVCGKCACDPTASWDARDNQDPLCTIRPCEDCHILQCERLNACALCTHLKSSCDSCAPFKASLTDQIIPEEDGMWHVCSEISTKDGCYTRFKYRYLEDEYRIELVVQSQDNCLESYYKYGGIALAVLLLLGILVVVAWKMVTHARDRREYERFLQEHAADLAPVLTNPCYKPASTTIQNPSFRKPSVDFRN